MTRIAYCADPARIGVDPDIERVCRRAAFALAEAGAVVEEIDLDLSAARKAFLALRGLWFMTQMSRASTGKRSSVSMSVTTCAPAARVTTRRSAAAEQERGRIWLRFRELFDRFDHVVTPCMAVPPFPVEQNHPAAIAGRKMETYVDWIAPTFVLSLTGLPVASVPCGLDAGAMPVGLQIAGRPQGEESVLALAAVVQQQQPIGQPPSRGSSQSA